MRSFALLLLSFVMLAGPAAPGLHTAPSDAMPPAAVPQVVRTFPHDPAAFTQGLLWHDGALYESTGLEGRSDIRRVRLEDGKVLQRTALPSALFGEGMALWKRDLVSITWRSGIGWRWDVASLKQKAEFRYPGEGWGLTQDGRNLILSDGTPELRFLDPVTFAERRRVRVTVAGRPLGNLNELEYVKGEILANIWQTALIARINPATGQVKGWLDLRPIASRVRASGPDAVLNGIAWDARRDRLFVTGKNWPTLFEIRLPPA